MTYTYDCLNRIEKRMDARGNEISYIYDDIGRLTEKTGLASDSAEYTYDAVGNMLTAENYTGKTVKSYNSLNQLTELKTANGKTFRYSYDARGNMTEMIYPDDEMMPSGEKKVSYSYDASNRITSVTDWKGNETIYEYDGSGELVSITYPDGSIEFREYDSAGQLSQTYRCEKDLSNTIEYNQYEYDRDGLMLREEIEENSAAQKKISEMQYDDLGRLKYRTSSVGAPDKVNVTEETYYIDAAGNILTCDITKNGNSSENLLRDMEYDEQNKLIRTGDKKLWYDEDGNMLGIDDITTEKAVNSISIEKNSTNAIAKSAVKNSPSWTGVSANKASYRKKVPEKKESTTEAAVTGTADAEGAGSDDEEASGDDSEDHQSDEQQVSAISEDGSYEEYYYDSSNHLLSAEATEYGYDAEENRYGIYDRTTGKESLYTYADTPHHMEHSS